MASPELYEVRSLLRNTETCLYFCLRLTRRESQRWFTLCRKPNKTLTNDDHSSSGYVLARVPFPDSPFAHFSDLVAVGSYCKIENVAYSTARGTVIWFDTKLGMWRDLQGLVGLPKLPPSCRVRLANYGGKLAVSWDEKMTYDYVCDTISGYKKLIWCAEISLERHTNCEVRGKVEWFGHVLTVPRCYKFVSVVAVTL